ncbi:MAG: GAF domain-containing protein [Deltaproteobacteria bacterium]|nr:GAF domain-containing protein [Deltaproteobacteria bacterium]
MGKTTQIRLMSAQLAALMEVGKAFNSVIKVDELLQLVASKTSQLLGAERCSIYVVDMEQRVLWTRAALGTPRIEISLDSGIAGAVVRNQGLVNVPVAYDDPRFNASVDRQTGFRTRSILASPLFDAQREVIGVLQLLNSRRGEFSEEDEEMLTSLAGFAGSALQNALLFEELKTSFHSVLAVLAATVDAKHPLTAGHTARVAEYTCGIAEIAGIQPSEIEMLRVAAYLHDYGKIGVRDAILTKPDRLTPDEYEEMKQHAVKTTEILSRMHFMRQYAAAPLIAGFHHEKWDGSGYPKRLKGKDIPVGARIMAMADVFDAITADRDYRKGVSVEQAMEYMRTQVGTAFDPELFVHFETYVRKRFDVPPPSRRRG